MSDRCEKLIRAKTLQQHRARITREIRVNGSKQLCFSALADAITDLSAAVAKLIDSHVEGPDLMICTNCGRPAPTLHIISKNVKVCPRCMRILVTDPEERAERLSRSA